MFDKFYEFIRVSIQSSLLIKHCYFFTAILEKHPCFMCLLSALHYSFKFGSAFVEQREQFFPVLTFI